MIYLVLLISLTLLAACDTVKQLAGQVVVSVENATEIDDFEIYAHGKRRFSLDAGEKKSFSVSGSGTSPIRIIVRHQRLFSDVVFELGKSEDGDGGGGSANLVIATEIRLGQEVVIVTCTNCNRSSAKSNPISH